MSVKLLVSTVGNCYLWFYSRKYFLKTDIAENSDVEIGRNSTGFKVWIIWIYMQLLFDQALLD